MSETQTASAVDQNFFLDNRDDYLKFVNTTDEKSVISERVAQESHDLIPKPPAMRVLDFGIGDGTVLTQVLAEMHESRPQIPFYVVGKEISIEDVRIALGKMSERFAEHPRTVFVVTNMSYVTAPWLRPKAAEAGSMVWHYEALTGNSSASFRKQLRGLEGFLNENWQTKPGTTLAEKPVALVVARADHEFVLNSVIPTRDTVHADYDLALGIQPWRSRTDADKKARNIISPLARSLAPGGKIVVIQSRGDNTSMDIVRSIWPDENPFPFGPDALIAAAGKELGPLAEQFSFSVGAPFEYHMHALPASQNGINTSVLSTAFSNAVYVAQMDSSKVRKAIESGLWKQATEAVLQHGRPSFSNDILVISRS